MQTQLDKTWDLRDELYRVFHRWPLLVAGFAIGALLGWLAAYIWPAYTRSTQTVYVGLNPYRAYSDAQFLALARPKYSNLDNYHYWQMSQLETVIFSPDFLDKTLASLCQQDPAWQQVDADGLRNMLDAEWRTAGDWDLVAVDRRSERAQQAVQAWSAVVVEQVDLAVKASQDAFMLDERLQEAGASLQREQRRIEAMTVAGQVFMIQLHQLGLLPQDDPIAPDRRYVLSGLVTEVAGDDAGWAELLATQPREGATVMEVRGWLSVVVSRFNIDASPTQLPARMATLEKQYADLRSQYQQAQAASLSLSPNLTIKDVSPVHSETVRPASTLALIGGLLGLLGWLLLELVRITRRSAARG